MNRGYVTLENPEKYLNNFRIPEDKLDKAIQCAANKMKSKLPLSAGRKAKGLYSEGLYFRAFKHM